VNRPTNFINDVYLHLTLCNEYLIQDISLTSDKEANILISETPFYIIL